MMTVANDKRDNTHDGVYIYIYIYALCLPREKDDSRSSVPGRDHLNFANFASRFFCMGDNEEMEVLRHLFTQVSTVF